MRQELEAKANTDEGMAQQLADQKDEIMRLESRLMYAEGNQGEAMV